nr:hypothetical protein [Pseudomonas aeruginosa]
MKLMTDSQGRLPKQQHLAMDPVQIRILGKGGNHGDTESNT